MTLTVRSVSREQHLRFIDEQGSASFLQCPSWGDVKQEWRAQSIGWYDASDVLVGAGLVLYRQIPRLRRFLAYIPEGPLIQWSASNVSDWLDPMVAHLRRERAFGVKMGPPVVQRRWPAAEIKAALAERTARKLADVPVEAEATAQAVTAALLRSGWRPPRGEGAFGAGQPQHVFQVPLAGRNEDQLLGSFNQLWRRNIKKATKAGVIVTCGTADDLADFHALYLETAQRDGFTGRPLSYFRQMWTAMSAEDPDRIRLYLARHEGDLVAATTMVRVGAHAWYSYGASSTAKREVRGSNAVQWQMMRDAMAAGAEVYDLRGITDTLDENDPHFGLIQFKLGTGGEAVEYVGEWDLPLNRLLFLGFEQYLKRRAA